MILDVLDILHGIFTIIFVSLSIITGIIIVSKYFKIRKGQFLLFGLFWIGLTTPWWPNLITFLIVLIIEKSISIQAFVVMGIAFLPITIILGLIAFSKVLPISKKTRRNFLIISFIPNILYEIFFFSVVFTNLPITLIATYLPPPEIFTIEWSLVSQIYFIISLVFFLIVGIAFSRVSMRSDNREIKLKGKFLLFAFLSFTVGTVLDFAIPSKWIYVIARLILVASTLAFYIGLMLPRWIKELFIKEP
jgi:hypothetical protein